MSEESKWVPWETFKKEADLLPIETPPCRTCQFWKPQRSYVEFGGSQKFDGVILCHGDMCRDFSCYKPKADKEGGQ